MRPQKYPAWSRGAIAKGVLSASKKTFQFSTIAFHVPGGRNRPRAAERAEKPQSD